MWHLIVLWARTPKHHNKLVALTIHPYLYVCVLVVDSTMGNWCRNFLQMKIINGSSTLFCQFWLNFVRRQYQGWWMVGVVQCSQELQALSSTLEVSCICVKRMPYSYLFSRWEIFAQFRASRGFARKSSKISQRKNFYRYGRTPLKFCAIGWGAIESFTVPSSNEYFLSAVRNAVTAFRM